MTDDTRRRVVMIGLLFPEEFERVQRAFIGQVTKDAELDVLGVHRTPEGVVTVSVRVEEELRSRVVIVKLSPEIK